MVNHFKAELKQFNRHTYGGICVNLDCEAACSGSTRDTEDYEKISVSENSE